MDSDLFGSLVASKNLDFFKSGYLRLAKKAMALYTEKQDTDFSTLLAIVADDALAYAISTSHFFKIDLSNNLFSVSKYTDSDKPALGFQSDLEFFNAKPHVSGTTKVSSYETQTDTFTERIDDLDADYPHPMVVNPNGLRADEKAGVTLVVGNGNEARQYDTDYDEHQDNEGNFDRRLTIPTEYVITRFLYWNDTIYALTRNIKGGHAKVFAWNGAGVGNNGAYGVGADWAYSGCEYGASFAVITSKGQLLSFNGGGFDFENPLANLPVCATGLSWTSNAATSSLLGKVASRGMEADGSTVFVNLNGELAGANGSPQGKYLPDMPSGLWSFDPKVGLTHLAGVNYEQMKTLTATGIASNRLVFTAAHEALTGDAVLCASASGVIGVDSGQTYFAIVDGPDAVQLALTEADAVAGRAIVLSGTPGGSDKYAFDSYASLGSGMVANAGPVFVLKTLMPNPFYGSRLLFGARAIDNALDSVGSLMSLGLGRNAGYFKTPKIAAAAVRDTFQSIATLFKELMLDTQGIAIKWRKADRLSLPSRTAYSGGAVVFTGPDIFTVDTTLKDFNSAAVGDEVEFITGAASGYLAHITAIDKTNPASYLITIDEELPVEDGDLTDCVVDNWTKLVSIDDDSEDNPHNFAEQAIGEDATWVQFKIALRGRDVSIESLQLTNEPHKLP